VRAVELYTLFWCFVSQDSFKTYPPIDEVFLQLRSDDAFAYLPNTGAVTGVQSSPFHRCVSVTYCVAVSRLYMYICAGSPIRFIWRRVADEAVLVLCVHFSVAVI
jgi:hypothetical protein